MDRSALVTGASRGIGAEIAIRLAQEGYSLTVAARGEPGVTAIAERLAKESGNPVHGVVADMADDDEVCRLAREHDEHFGRLDLLVLGAGLGTNEPIGKLSMARYDHQLAVNLRAPILLTQQCLPLLRSTAAAAKPYGARVVALSSLTGVVSEAGFAAYGASKAGLISFCETVCVEESAGGVSATAISPGYVDTDMTEAIRDKLDPSEMITTGDMAEMVLALTRLSANAVVPSIVVTRPGRRLWRA